jgi:tetratricopeptide (TPR) repeat protein
MNNNSLFVKIVIWSMVFLMSIGFIGLVIAPFMSPSMFGGGSGRGATEELVAEARADLEKLDCANEDKTFTGAKLEDCQDALKRLASAYTTLAQPEEGAEELPRDSQRNIDRAGEAFQRLYEIDPKDDDNAALWAGFLRDTGKSEQALEVWTVLVKRNPNNEDYLLQQAGAYQQTQQLDKSIAALRLFVKKFPDSGQIDQIKEEIKSLQEQQKEQAAGGGQAPISLG